MRAPSVLLGLALALAVAIAAGTLMLGDGRGSPAQAAVQAPPSGEGGASEGAGLPDLVVSNISFGPTGFGCSASTAVFVTVDNIGAGSAGTSSLWLNGSQEPVPPLPPSTGYTAMFTAQYFGDLTATADVGDLVVESNETNNSLTVPPFPTPTALPTCTYTPTPTPAATYTPTFSPTGGFQGDTDGDGWPGNADNCPQDYNPGQENNDKNLIPQSPPLTQDDATRARSDIYGDVCDPDDDNDGLDDSDETAGTTCAAITDPMLSDTDGDGARDGAECALGTSPVNASNKPSAAQCAAAAGSSTAMDSDLDNLLDRIEYCGYNTDKSYRDSEGDGIHDGCEAVSLNGDWVVNSGDQLQLAFGVMGDLLGPPHPNADVNKDGGVNSGDQLLMAMMMMPQGQCPNGGPDLTVQYMKIELITGEGCYTNIGLGVRAFVMNQGSIAAGPFVVEINSTPVSVSGLAAGATVGPWVAGHHYPNDEHAYADSQFEVAETNELNNELYEAPPIPTLPVPCTATPTATPTP